MKQRVFFLLLICAISFSCKKNGPGGKALLNGLVTYNGKGVVSGTVYIKYGAKTSPGNNPTDYDSQTSISSTGNYSFPSLFHEGDYFLYVIGSYPNQWGGYQQVTADTTVSITTTKSTTVTVNISTK